MPDFATERTITALRHMIEEMQFLVSNPRMQQKRWVAMGRTWLPTLHQAIEDLSRLAEAGAAPTPRASDTVTPSASTILIQVSLQGGDSYININLDEVAEVSDAQRGVPSQPVQSGEVSSFRLKNGTTYLTTVYETRRLVEALRKRSQG